MINRHNKCVGLTIFRLGRRQLELWYCPQGEIIEPHVHNKIDSTLIILGGSMTGYIGERHGRIGWRDFLRFFFIPAGVVHGANITGRFCLFANFETWRKGDALTSAAIDFDAV